MVTPVDDFMIINITDGNQLFSNYPDPNEWKILT
jgi:hypothetical protein